MKSNELFETSILNEFKMSPTNLRALAKDTNAIAGMEFEMAVPGQGDDDDEPDLTPDYDEDFRPRSIRDILNFFDSDYNSSSVISRLENKLENSYRDYAENKLSTEWNKEAEEVVSYYIASLDPDLNMEELNSRVSHAIETKNIDYDEAYSQWRGNQSIPTVRDWLSDSDMNSMRDVLDNYSELTWPYWTQSSQDKELKFISEIAGKFQSAIGKEVLYSDTYHKARRASDVYSLEPDGSIEAQPGDSGLEFISPPMPVDELLADLVKVKSWAKSEGCYTNESTGLHINVSIPGFDRNKLDYVKLAILIGDEYVLEQFGRLGNEYSKSAIQQIKKTSRKPQEVEEILNMMKNKLNVEVSKLIYAGNTEKNTSINAKKGYIEFRSAGGDWINEDLSKIENTILRFVVGLDAAHDENKYRQEYLKKLYKILAPKNDTDPISYFAKYAAGELQRNELSTLIKSVQTAREYDKGADKNTENRYWFKVTVGNASVEIVAKSKDEAIEKARGEFGINAAFYPDSNFKTEVLRRYIPDNK